MCIARLIWSEDAEVVTRAGFWVWTLNVLITVVFSLPDLKCQI